MTTADEEEMASERQSGETQLCWDSYDTEIKFCNDNDNRPFSYSTKEPGSSDIFIHFDAQGSIEWRWSFDHHCAYSKIRQIVMKYRSIHILFQNS